MGTGCGMSASRTCTQPTVVFMDLHIQVHGRIYHVIRFGPAVRHQAGKQRDLESNPLRLSFLFKSCGMWTLSCDFVPHNETLKWLSSLPILMQESFWSIDI